ncbi:hypothetical protein BD769DRAFT_1442693 [Suillus cothurnatus]|nr:hypothetical protein BD769DRAFT_1442693 [Suillus cothurnatus]
MLRVFAGIKAEPVSNVLPKELSMIVNDVSSDMPTHMFAVFSSRQPAPARHRITLFPAHNLVFATHCANLPILPTSTPALVECAGQEIKVPVIPLCIPFPEFAQKIADMYMVKTLLLHIAKVHGTWCNTMALGIADKRLWCALNTAWEVLLTSLAISTGQPHLMTESA